ncbi:MAG: hypothetical protein LBS43_03690, partial [Prevotellaceae bacterium]|nr:hypothetical protein [Prevotellaceae bacterium]
DISVIHEVKDRLSNVQPDSVIIKGIEPYAIKIRLPVHLLSSISLSSLIISFQRTAFFQKRVQR